MVDAPRTALLMGGKNSITDAHMACWTGLCDLFFARRDRLGRRLPDVISDTSGKPVVGPWRWKNQAYNRMDYQGLNSNVIAQHLSGVLTDDYRDRVQLQTYAAAPDGTAVWTAIDLDVQGEAHADVDEHFDTQALAREAARKLIAETEALGLVAHLEITKSAGYRVWMFHARCPWNQARDLGRLLVQRAGLHPKTEVFPSTVPADKDGFGTAVLVPFWGGNAKQGRQVMIDPTTEQVRTVAEFAAHALTHRTEPARLAEIVTAAAEAGEIKQTAAKRERSERTNQDGDGALAQGAEVADPCWQAQLAGCEALREMVQRCEDGRVLSRAEWMRLATHLKKYGDWGLAEFHRLSAFDSRYMEHETDMMFDSLVYGPTNCDKMECGRDPQGDCGMADGKVNSSWFAYKALKQLHMVGEAEQQADADKDAEAAFNRELALLDPTDLGNAQRLLMRHGHEMRYSPAENAWYVWDGQVWVKHGNEATAPMGRAAHAMQMIKNEAATLADGQDLFKHAMKSQGSDRIKAALNLLRMTPQIAVDPSDWDRQPELVNVENGTLQLRSQTLREFDADDYMTARMPVVYEPSAKCPNFDRFIADVVPDVDLRRYVQKWLGYGLTGLTREQIFLFLFGSGQNGKSTLINVIRDIMGKQLHTSISSRTIMDDPNKNSALAMVPFVSPRAVTMTEGKENARFDEELIKAVTGGDDIVARRHYELEFSFKPQLKLTIAANHKPKITGTDKGIWRRVRLVPFEQQIVKVDPDLPAKLANEKSGILNWMLLGLAAYYAEGLKTPQAVLDATAEYQKDSDVLGIFLEECCVKDAGAKLNGGVLYKTYADWCELNGNRPLANNHLANKIKERGFEKGGGRERYTWVGLRLRTFAGSLGDEEPQEVPIREEARLNNFPDLEDVATMSLTEKYPAPDWWEAADAKM